MASSDQSTLRPAGYSADFLAGMEAAARLVEEHALACAFPAAVGGQVLCVAPDAGREYAAEVRRVAREERGEVERWFTKQMEQL